MARLKSLADQALRNRGGDRRARRRFGAMLAVAALALGPVPSADASRYTPESARARGKVCRARAVAQHLREPERTMFVRRCVRYPLS